MPISVTCQCGARLEIDEKFLGKEIPCPDCQRPLPTKPPATPPPLDLPDNRRTSGLAGLSLALGLVGFFTMVGSLAAIALGVLALKKIAQQPNKFEGASHARAGIILGAAGMFVTLASLASPTVFGVDIFLRELALVNNVSYPGTDPVKTDHSIGDNIDITRPAPADRWAVANPSKNLTNNQNDLIILINVMDDAYIACQTVFFDGGVDNEEDKQKKVLERFYKSELINLLGRLNGKPLNREGTFEAKLTEGGNKQEITLDLRLCGIERRFLIQYSAKDRDKVTLFIGAARTSRFDRIQESFREAFKSIKIRA